MGINGLSVIVMHVKELDLIAEETVKARTPRALTLLPSLAILPWKHLRTGASNLSTSWVEL